MPRALCSAVYTRFGLSLARFHFMLLDRVPARRHSAGRRNPEVLQQAIASRHSQRLSLPWRSCTPALALLTLARFLGSLAGVFAARDVALADALVVNLIAIWSELLFGLVLR